MARAFESEPRLVPPLKMSSEHFPAKKTDGSPVGPEIKIRWKKDKPVNPFALI